MNSEWEMDERHDEVVWSWRLDDGGSLIDLLLKRENAIIFTGLPAKLCQVNEMSRIFAGTGTVKCNAYSFTNPSRT